MGKLNLYFHHYKLVIEVDEVGHIDKNIDYEIKRQEVIKEKLDCKFIRINPDEEHFNIFKAVNEILRHIKELTEKSTKKSVNKLLRLEFKKYNSIKAKCLKYVVKHIFSTI